MNDDLISRQAAIDALGERKTAEQCGEGKIRNWAVDLCVDRIKKLPSVQSEIIRCKDCKWNCFSGCSIVHNNEELPSAQPEIVRCKDCFFCEQLYGDYSCQRFIRWTKPDDYCSHGERRPQ